MSGSRTFSPSRLAPPIAASVLAAKRFAARPPLTQQRDLRERRMYQNVVTVTMAFFVAFVFGSPLLSLVLALIMPLLIFAGYIQVFCCSIIGVSVVACVVCVCVGGVAVLPVAASPRFRSCMATVLGVVRVLVHSAAETRGSLRRGGRGFWRADPTPSRRTLHASPRPKRPGSLFLFLLGWPGLGE